ncbi:hypothetical protein D9M70_596720 [compost metagenome]
MPVPFILQIAVQAGEEADLILVERFRVEELPQARPVHGPGIGGIVLTAGGLRRRPSPWHKKQGSAVATGLESLLDDLAAEPVLWQGGAAVGGELAAGQFQLLSLKGRTAVEADPGKEGVTREFVAHDVSRQHRIANTTLREPACRL